MSGRSVTILGGGLCGALLAIILARRGISTTVLERQPDPRVKAVPSGRSINLALAARGIRALKYAGVYENVQSLLVPMKGRRIHARDGTTEFHAYGLRESEVVYSVSRAGLNLQLVEAAAEFDEVSFQFEHEALAFYPEKAVLRVRDLQNFADYDVVANPLIAADGAGSIVRRAYDNSSVIRGTEELLPHSYKELGIPAGAKGSYQLDPNALHIWPRGGFMLIALPNPGGDFTLTLFLPNEGDPGFASLESNKDVDRFFRNNFPDTVPLIDNLAEIWQQNPVGVLGTVRSAEWHDGGNVLLIGDAAHAVVPFHGQGMNLGFEDCVVLDQVLENRDADWEAVFKTFEREQQDNANAIADMALENYVEMRDTVRDPKHLLRHDLAFALEERLPECFIPRYSMVMFHAEIPYSVAQQRGALQNRLLDELTESATTLEDIDLNAAVALVESRLPPLR